MKDLNMYWCEIISKKSFQIKNNMQNSVGNMLSFTLERKMYIVKWKKKKKNVYTPYMLVYAYIASG